MELPDERWCDWCQDHTIWRGDKCESCLAEIAERAANLAELDRLRAINAKLLAEMKRYLPILEGVESEALDWDKYTAGTGIATLNGYLAAIAKAEGE